MLITEIVKVKIINFNVEYYNKKGYECKIGDTIDVIVEDVSKFSKAPIVLECDCCHKESKEVKIVSYYDSKCYKDGEYVCDKCRKLQKESKECDICGSKIKVTNYKNKGVLLCSKHQKHMIKYGKIKRTSKDKNEIRIFEDYIEFDTYDIKGEVNCTYKADLNLIDFIKTHKMHKHKDGYACYKFRDESGKVKNMRFHRYVMGVEKDINSEYVVDHINRDKTDDRKENLRIVSHEANNRNVGMYSHNTSGYKGISYNKQLEKWEVYIHQHNKKIGLGYYINIEKAIKVREMAELFYFGTDSPNYNELVKKYMSTKEIHKMLLEQEE